MLNPFGEELVDSVDREILVFMLPKIGLGL